MPTIRFSSLTSAATLAIAMAVAFETPSADAFIQQAGAPLLGATLDASQEITLAQNDTRRRGRGDGARRDQGDRSENARGGRSSRGDGARGGRGSRSDGASEERGRGSDSARGGRSSRGDGAAAGRRGSRGDGGARGGRGPQPGAAVLPNESRSVRTANVPGDRNRGGRGAGSGRGGNDNAFRGGRGGHNDGARGSGRGGRGDGSFDNRGGRNDTYRGSRGGRNDAYRGSPGGRNDAYRGSRGGRNDAYRGSRGGHDAGVNRYRGYRGGHSYRDSRGTYRRGYVNGSIDAHRYYSSYRRPVRSNWHYHARYYDAGYNRHNYRYYDRGCRANGDQVLAGAILGALFGSAVSDDYATGAVVGGFFGAGIGAALNSCDRGQLHYAVGYSFTHNSPYYWHNPYTGVRGVVYARDYYTVGNRRCRWGDAEIYMPDGSFVIDEVRMCQDAYGRWQVASYQ